MIQARINVSRQITITTERQGLHAVESGCSITAKLRYMAAALNQKACWHTTNAVLC